MFTTLESSLKDVSYAMRQLRKAPAFTITAILLLALGIGAVTAVFGVLDATMLQPLAYPHAERLVEIARTSPRYDHPVPVSGPDFLDWRNRINSFEAMAAYACDDLTHNGASGPEQLEGCRVSADFFQVLGLRMTLGRAFGPAEERQDSHHVAVLGYGLWHSRFAGNPSTIGRTVYLDSEAYTVIGILPQELKFEEAPDCQIWIPLVLSSSAGRGNHALHVIGRRVPGVSPRQAQAELDLIAHQLQKEYPADDGDQGIIAINLSTWISRGTTRQLLAAFLGTALLVLLVVCANLAGLTLARGAARAKILAMRASLGASTGRLIRELLLESVLLSLLGGVPGIAFAWLLCVLFKHHPVLSLPRADTIAVDLRVLLFAFMLTIVTGLVFGLVPALQIARADLTVLVKEGSIASGQDRRLSMRGMVVSLQIAFSLILVVSAGLMTRSMIRMLRTDPGYTTNHLLTFWLTAPPGRYPNSTALGNLKQHILERIRIVPGVMSCDSTTALPPSGWEDDEGFVVLQHPPSDMEHAPATYVDAISPGLFRTLHIPILEGRALTENDNRVGAAKVVVISRSLAKNYFKGEDPLGQSMRFEEDTHKYLWTVVGVAGDTRFFGWDHDNGVFTYFPYRSIDAGPHFAVVVRTTAKTGNLSAAVKQAVWSIDKDLPLLDVATMQQRLHDTFAPRRFNTLVLTAFAFLALLLASLGIFGMMAYFVSQKTREIGLRLALGARKQDVLRLILGQALRLVTIGMMCGYIASFFGAQVLEGLLYGASPFDAATFLAAGVAMLLSALTAAYLPAQRAAAIDPMSALRWN